MSTTHFWQSGRYVSDGGLETDLIFNRGVDLPEFASFPLVENEAGRAHLRAYYDEYADIARAAGVGLTLESPTWRASRDWGAKVGYDAAALDRANRAAIALLQDLRASYADVEDVRIIGAVGPRGDGYVAEEAMTPEQATEFHLPQVESFADAGVDVVGAYTMTTAAEGLGVARAARSVGLPVLIGFTVETDGRLPDGTTLRRGRRAAGGRGGARRVHRELRPPDPHRAGLGGRRVAEPDRAGEPERLHAEPC